MNITRYDNYEFETTMSTYTPIPSKSATTATKTIAATLGINAWCVQIERQAQ